MTLADNLHNVRKATRLLASYNARVLDILREVESTLAGRPLTFLWWTPTNAVALGKTTTTPTSRTSWSFLPLSDFSAYWSTGKRERATAVNDLFVGFSCVVDSGFPLDADPAVDTDPADFPDAVNTKSFVYAWIYALASGATATDWLDIQDHHEASAPMDTWWTGAVQDISQIEGETAKFRFVGWRIEMVNLESREHLDERVLTPLRNGLAAILAPAVLTPAPPQPPIVAGLGAGAQAVLGGQGAGEN